MPAERPTRVFISYSRRDREIVGRVVEALEKADDIEVFRDTDDILPTEEWKQRLEQLIGEADTIVFALSPNSVKSDVCNWEIEYAESLNKRIAPIVIKDVEGQNIPPSLSKFNYIFFTNRREFDRSITNLTAALNTDIEWIREHTRLGELARRWEAQQKRAVRVLRGSDLKSAEDWLARHPANAPQPTEEHRSYIAASRRSATRRLQYGIFAAIALAVFAFTLGGYAYLQREEALRSEARTLSREVQLLMRRSMDMLGEGQVQESLETALTAYASAQQSQHDDALNAVERGLTDIWHSPGWPEKQMPAPASDLKYITCADWTPDGRTIVSVNRDKVVFWDQADGTVTALETNADSSQCVAMSPDSRFAAVYGEAGQVLVFDLANRRKIVVSVKLGNEVRNVSFSRDGGRMLLSTREGTVSLWDMKGFRESWSANIGALLWDALLSPDGNTIAILGFEGDIRLWQASDHSEIKVFEQLVQSPSAMAFSPDGFTLAVGAAHGRMIFIDIRTQAPRADTIELKNTISAIEYSPDGGIVAVSSIAERSPIGAFLSKSEIALWRSDGSAQLAKLPGTWFNIVNVEFSSDGRRLLAASKDGATRVWSVPEFSIVATLSLEGAQYWDTDPKPQQLVLGGQDYENRLTVAAFSPTADMVMTARMHYSKSPVVWDISPHRSSGVIEYDTARIQDFGFLAAPGSAALIDGHGRLKLWSMSGNVPDQPALSPNLLKGTATVSPSGSYLAAKGADGIVRVWQTSDWHQIAELPKPGTEAWQLVFSPDEKLLASVSNEYAVSVWDLKTKSLLQSLNAPEEKIGVTRVRFSPDGSFLAVWAYQPCIVLAEPLKQPIRILDIETGAVASIPVDTADVSSLDFVDRGETLATGHKNGLVRVWNIASGSVLLERGHITGAFTTQGIMPDDDRRQLICAQVKAVPQTRQVLSWANRDATVQIFHSGEESKSLELRAHTEAVSDVALTSDGKRAISTSHDGTVRLWSTETGESLGSMNVSSSRMKMSPNGKFLALMTRDSKMHIVEMFPHFVAEARKKQIKCMTKQELSSFGLSETDCRRQKPQDTDR